MRVPADMAYPLFALLIAANSLKQSHTSTALRQRCRNKKRPPCYPHWPNGWRAGGGARFALGSKGDLDAKRPCEELEKQHGYPCIQAQEFGRGYKARHFGQPVLTGW